MMKNSAFFLLIFYVLKSQNSLILLIHASVSVCDLDAYESCQDMSLVYKVEQKSLPSGDKK